MNYIKTVLKLLRLIKTSQTGYSQTMKIIDRLKTRIRLIITLIVLWALIVLGLLIYIAVRVSA